MIGFILGVYCCACWYLQWGALENAIKHTESRERFYNGIMFLFAPIYVPFAFLMLIMG